MANEGKAVIKNHENLNDLFYRELLVIASPSLIERYNKALERITGKRTSLTQFRIDKTGYSPDIAEEFDDPDYLDKSGINKKFILISIAQKDLPVLRACFSLTGDFISDFIECNHESVLTLTALDAVFGEMENNIYSIDSIDDVINSDRVNIHVESTKNLINIANQLNEKIAQINKGDIEKWLDDSYLQNIADLAKMTGNIKHNHIIPKNTFFQKSFYYTELYGGLYVFKGLSDNSIAKDNDVHIIYMSNYGYILDTENFTKGKGGTVKLYNGKDFNQVYQFLVKHDLIEDMALSHLASRKDVMRMKQYQVIADLLSVADSSVVNTVSGSILKKDVNEIFDKLPELFHHLYRLVSSTDRDLQVIEQNEEALFYTCRVSSSTRATQNKFILNHLLSNYTPYSYMRTITYNPNLFALRFASFNDVKKQYVTRYVQQASDFQNNVI